LSTQPPEHTAAQACAATRQAVAEGNRILSITGLSSGVRASMGHVSARDPDSPGRFIVKGRGYAIDVLARMLPGNMVVCDLDGMLLDGPRGAVPCNEVMIHASIYRARPEVKSVVHVHPPYCVMLTVQGLPIRPMVLEGIRLVRHPLPVYAHTALVTRAEQGRELARELGSAPAIQLLGHGAVTVGQTIEEAVMAMVHLEHQARLNWQARAVAGANFQCIPDHLIEEFLQWQPMAEPHFQDALAKAGPVGGTHGIWPDLVDRARRDMAECGIGDSAGF
jgi:L-fuculose-phosphate aldolase